MTQNTYSHLSREQLVGALERRDATLQAILNVIHLPNKNMAPGEKLFWIGAQSVLLEEQTNEQGLTRLPLDDIAKFNGMSESSNSRYANAVLDRYGATKETVPYVTQKGQKCDLTYIDRADTVWKTPWEIDLPEEKQRVLNGNGKYCERCKTYNLKVTTHRLTYQEIQECECCGYQKISAILSDKSELTPGEYIPEKKGPQAGEPFGEAPISATPSVYTRAIEDELRQLSQWVVWRYDEDGQGKPTKVPYIARLMRMPQKAKTNDPGTWESYDQAQAIYEQSQREGWKHPYDGIGFVFNSNSIVGIDLDHCIDEQGHISEEAQAIVERLGTYAEISVSKTGLHLYARGTLPRNIKQPGIELYDHARFFTWTGRQLPGTPESIMDCQAALDALCAEIAPPPVAAPPIFPTSGNISYSHTDAEILGKMRNDAKAMKLWEGDQAYIAATYPKKDGSPDYSCADLALCRKLSYWGAGGDVSTIDRLFQQSRLMRPKWFKNVGNGETYGQRTIRVAIGEQERQAS